MKDFDLRIDGDVLLYRAGYAADSRSVELSHSLHNAKLIVGLLKKKFPGKCTILLSSRDPKVNWRNALVDNYKINRLYSDCCDEHVYKDIDDRDIYICKNCKTPCMTVSKKPLYYDEIRKFLIDRFEAKICPWGEADDWLCVKATTNTVVASIDKDLLMVPNIWHYRMHTDKLLRSSDPGRLFLSDDNKKLIGVGFKWFCAQLLLGDAVDNIIKPKKGLGPASAMTHLEALNNVNALWSFIVSFYDKHSTSENLELNAQLLWIARSPRQRWTPELMSELAK